MLALLISASDHGDISGRFFESHSYLMLSQLSCGNICQIWISQVNNASMILENWRKLLLWMIQSEQDSVRRKTDEWTDGWKRWNQHNSFNFVEARDMVDKWKKLKSAPHLWHVSPLVSEISTKHISNIYVYNHQYSQTKFLSNTANKTLQQKVHLGLWYHHITCRLPKLIIPLNGSLRGMSTTFGTKITIWIFITVHPPTWLRAISHTDWRLTVNLTASNASSDDIMITL